QGVEHGDGGGLGGGEPAGGHTHHNDDDRAGRPDGLAQLVDQVLDAELIAAGVVVFDGQDVDAHHQADGQDAAGEVAGQEQAAHRDAAGGGGVDDHVVAGRHQDALHRRGDGDGGGKVGVVALVHHHGDQDGAQGGGVGRRRARDAAKEVRVKDVDHAQAAAHPADAGVGQRHQLVGQA